MIQRNRLTTLAVSLVLGGVAFAANTLRDEECTASAEQCPTGKKVTALIAQWETVSEEAKSMSAEQREQLGAKVASVAASCPVGSRLGDTVSAVRDVLGMVVASQEANAEHCPLAGMENPDEACIAAKEMKAARIQTVQGLYQLANYTAGASCSDAAAQCAASSADEAAAPVAEAACAEKSANCPIRMASRIGTLKASFADACVEAENLTSEGRQALAAGFASLGEGNQAITLVPQSVAALAEGFEVLNKIHGQMGEWAQANPEVLASMPASAHQAFMMEVALVDETRGLLASVTKAMHTLQGTEPVKVGDAGTR